MQVGVRDRGSPKAGFSIAVNGISGALCQICAQHSWLVLDLKCAISAEIGIPISQQRLLMQRAHVTREMKDAEYVVEKLDVETTRTGCVMQVSLIRRPEEQLEWLRRVEVDGLQLKHAPELFQASHEIVLAAVKSSGGALKHAAQELQADPVIALAAVQQNGLALQFAAPSIRSNKHIVLTAVAENGLALQSALGECLEDEEIALAALRCDSHHVNSAAKLLSNVAPQLRNNRAVVLEAVRQNGMALKDVSAELRSDRDVVLTAVQQRGGALQFAGLELKDDIDIVLKAVMQSGLALAHASRRLRSNRTVVLSAVGSNPHALIHMAPELHGDVQISSLALHRFTSSERHGAY